LSDAADPPSLATVEDTRLGLKLAGLGFLLLGLAPLAWTLPPQAHSEWGSAYTLALVLAGCGLLAIGLATTAPTPQGPLPRWLRTAFVALFALAALDLAFVLALRAVGIAREELPIAPASARQAQSVVGWAALLACVALTWILWRFCQHRGLTGRALSWLWIAVLASGSAFALWTSERIWPAVLFAPLGVLAFLLARQTARDVWLDAIYKTSKAALERSKPPVESESTARAPN
jgi:hypothetical protein